MVRFIAPAAAVAVIAVIALAGGELLTSAQTDPIVSVDAVSDSGNTATSVGPIDTCLSTTTGASFDVDVVIQGVTNISGLQADLLYNPAVLKVTAVDYNFLLTTTGAAVLDLGSSTTDMDGDFLLAAAMFSLVSVTGASGDGVLARVTFQALGSGSSALDLTNVKLSDASGNPIPPIDANNFYIGPVNNASVVVDSVCGAVDSDGDTIPDGSDNCPAWPNAGQSLPPWPVPADDPDCDGWSTSDENTIGTLWDAHCAATSSVDDEAIDASPPDFNDDRFVDIADINAMRPPVFDVLLGKNTTPPNPSYSERFDLNIDGFINITDVNAMRPPIFNLLTPCGP